MPRNNIPVDLDAAADLSTKEGCFAKYTATGINVCTVLGERAHAVILNTPLAAVGSAVASQIGAKVRVKVGAVAVAKGAELTTNANALAITAVSTNVVFCLACEAGNAGTTIDALVVAAYIKP